MPTLIEAKKHFQRLEQNSRVDRDNGTIHGVSLIKMGPAIGHDEVVDATTLRQMFDLATEKGTLKVKADHNSGVLDTIGYIDNFSLSRDKLIGDFHLYDEVPDNQKNIIYRIAESNPDHAGFSVEFSGEPERINKVNYTRADELLTAALVSDPAANTSLFAKVDDEKSKNDKRNTMATQITKLSDPTAGEVKNAKPNGADDADQKTDANKSLFDMITDMAAKMTAMHDRMGAYEQAAGDGKNKGDQPPITDPKLQPKTQNDGTNFDDKPTDDEKEEASKGVDEKVSAKENQFARVAREAAEAAVTKLSAKMGFNSLKAAGASENKSMDNSTKKFEQLVEEKTQELLGTDGMSLATAKQKAMVFCLKSYPKQYEAYRPVAPDKDKKNLAR